MTKPLFRLSAFSFRSQLIYGIGFFLTFLLTLFIYVQTTYNNQITRERELKEASEHSRVLASMIKVWVMSNDYVGLEEALENFSEYNNLVFAAVINMDGKVIAHTDKSLVGTYVADQKRIAYLQKIKETNDDSQNIFRHGVYTIDVFRPIHSGDEYIGLIHLRLDQHAREKMIRDRIYQGIGFGILYLFVTVLILYLIVTRMSRQLASLLETMKKVHSGDKSIKADENGYNEMSSLAHEFNSMLDAITAGESELKAVKERLEYAVNGTNDGLWDWNVQTDEIYFSPRWKEMLGYKEDELPNTINSWSDNVHPDDLERAEQDVLYSHQEPGHLYKSIYRIRHKNGNWIWILDRGQTLFDEEGKPIRMVGFQTDITKEKELEQQLFEREEMMIAQSRHVAMGEMIGMIAHQWRQPITAIAMGGNNILVDLAFGNMDAENFKKEAELIVSQTQHLSKTIDDFRNFFRPNKDIDEVKVIDVLKETQEIIGKSLEHHNILLTIEGDEERTIQTYSRELLQVFLNIIKNAQEAIEEHETIRGSICVDVHTKEDTVEIAISDNGGGINPDILPHVFEPYFSTKGKKNGTGLGLYMVKTIIEKHLNGKIIAENVEGGMKFVINIPKYVAKKEDHE